MTNTQLEVPKRLWNDKRIKPEGKLIYSYIYSKGQDRIITDLNVGELQQVVRISNQGLKKNLRKLEDAIAFQNVSNMPARVKCALLAWHTVEDMLDKKFEK